MSITETAAPPVNTPLVGTPDAFIRYDFLPAAAADGIIAQLESEVAWNPLVSFSHSNTAKGRVGSFQGEPLASGAVPYLRCPSIAKQPIMPFTPNVAAIRDQIQREYQDDMNIAKIQKYEDGKANIPPHADKIIDLALDVPIYNARFGSTRTVLLINKLHPDQQIAVEMRHNSLLILGPRTNDEWTHSVPVTNDGKLTGASYSIIFRQAVTYMHAKTDFLFGPRTRFPTEADLVNAILDGSIQTLERPAYDELKALFSLENKQPVTIEHYRNFINRSF